MVTSAQKDQVPHNGGPAVDPVLPMVGVGPLDRCVATRESAVAVARDQSPHLARADRPSGSACPAVPNLGDGGVAGQPARGLSGDRARPAEVSRPCALIPAERFGPDQEREMRLHAAHLGQGARVQLLPRQLDQRIRPALGPAPCVAVLRDTHQSVEDCLQVGAALGVQLAVDPVHVAHVAQPQSATLVGPIGVSEGTLGIDGMTQMRRRDREHPGIKLPGRLEQDRLALDHRLSTDRRRAAGDHPRVVD